MIRNLLILPLLTLIAKPVAAEDLKPPPSRRNFVACPVVRDTKTVPCWLAEYKGEVYYLGIQQDIGADFYPPQLNHKILVEGTVSDGARVCGGIALNSVHVSVLREIDRECNTILPAEEGIDAPPAARGPGPSSKQNVVNVGPPPTPPDPKPPYQSREFKIVFDFDNDFLTGKSTRILGQAAHYATLIHASAIDVSAYRGATLLSNGGRFEESSNIAEVRAKKIGELLEGLGVASSELAIHWSNEPRPADGVTDPLQRQVVIVVKP
jgi:hypothetical protein